MDKTLRIARTFMESNTEFEKAVNKGCYQGDDNEVKEKHINYMLQCYSSSMKDIEPMDALQIYLQKHIEYQHDFRRNMKSFIVLHRSIEYNQSSNNVLYWLSHIYPDLANLSQAGVNNGPAIIQGSSQEGLSLNTYTPKDG